MNLLESLPNQLGGETAVAVDAFAGCCGGANGSVTSGNLVETPAEQIVGSPSGAAISGSNPDACCATAVTDEKRPLGLEVRDIAVGNCFGGERVDHDQSVIAENQLWAKPDGVSAEGKSQTENNGKRNPVILGGVKNHLNQVEGIQDNGACTPHQICAGTEDSLVSHSSIFATAQADGKNFAK